jgi:hypothetical protein
MKSFLRATIVALGLLIAPSIANAATCFWVGGTASWTTANAASWASSTGGTASSCAATGGVPKNAGDVATFDGNSGGGTVTVNANLSIGQISAGAFTGTLDWSANNNNLTLSVQFGISGSGTRTINCGTGTWTFTGLTSPWWVSSTRTGLTENCSSVNIVVAPSTTTTGNLAAQFGASESLGPITITWPAASGFPLYLDLAAASTLTIASLTITGSPQFIVSNATTLSITAAPAIAGTQSHLISFVNALPGNGTQFTITTPNTATFSWCFFQNVKLTNSITATSSYDGGDNSGFTITAPSASGGTPQLIGGN